MDKNEILANVTSLGVFDEYQAQDKSLGVILNTLIRLWI